MRLKHQKGDFLQIHVENLSPNDQSPELSGKTSSHKGSGCVVDLKRFSLGQGLWEFFQKHRFPKLAILTNAHVASQNPTKITARFVSNGVVAVCRVAVPEEGFEKFVAHDRDLALLFVDPRDYAEFENQVTSVVFSSILPAQGEEVWAVGFPQGSDALAVTKGNLTRYRHSDYAHSKVPLFNMEVTAPINGGNSGGGLWTLMETWSPLFIKV